MPFLDTDIFAQIIAREIPADIVLENEQVIAFRDIAPKADTHIVITTKEAIKTAKEVTEDNLETFGAMFLAAKQMAHNLGLEGYKLHMNVDEEGGQVVPRVHLHLLSPDFKTNL